MRNGKSKRLSRRQKLVAIAVPLIFVAVGGGIAAFGFRNLVRASASVDWPSVEGTIRASSVERSGGRESGRSSRGRIAEIRYEYFLDGRTYRGDRIAYGNYGSPFRSHAQNIVDKYPVGEVVTVRYMPGDPEESLLEPGLKIQSWLLPLFGLVFLAAGIAASVLIPRGMAERQADPELKVVDKRPRFD